MKRLARWRWVWAGLALGMSFALPMPAGAAAENEVPLRTDFSHAVSHALDVPEVIFARYATALDESLGLHQIYLRREQFVVLVDRSPAVQVMFVVWGNSIAGWSLVGAAPVSTGLPGRFEHFATPIGVYEHALTNPDFRAEGTRNALGIRGYGRKGLRIYDFGWVAARKGWGDGAWSVMRLQMHATDPDVLEPRLGTAQSKGCIRIPAAVNQFLDLRGVLDADYDEALDENRALWVLRADRQRSAWAGRWLVVVDSEALERPDWASPSPRPPVQRIEADQATLPGLAR